MRGTRLVSLAIVTVVAVGLSLSAVEHPVTARGEVWGFSEYLDCDVQISSNLRTGEHRGEYMSIGSLTIRAFDLPNADHRVAVFTSSWMSRISHYSGWFSFWGRFRLARFPGAVFYFRFRVKDDEAGDSLELGLSCDTCNPPEPVQLRRGKIVVEFDP